MIKPINFTFTFFPSSQLFAKWFHISTKTLVFLIFFFNSSLFFTFTFLLLTTSTGNYFTHFFQVLCYNVTNFIFNFVLLFIYQKSDVYLFILANFGFQFFTLVPRIEVRHIWSNV